MTKPIRIFTVLAAMLALGTSLTAADAVRVATVDLNRALNEYWKTQKKTGEWRDRSAGAQEQVNDAQKRLEELAGEISKLREEANNAALTQEAKDRITGDAERKIEEFEAMRERLAQYVENTQRDLDRDRRLFMDLMYGEINTVVMDIGRQRGANLIIDTSGRTTSGLSPVLYADASFDITSAVLSKLNESKPADFVPPAPPAENNAPASTGQAPTGQAPAGTP